MVIPIPGTRRAKHLEENCAAAAIELTSEEVERVTSAIDLDRVAGQSSSPRDPNSRPSARLTPPG
jgi:aryl-alcohol dehydrogenase-like predicted oxidoreductase